MPAEIRLYNQSLGVRVLVRADLVTSEDAARLLGTSRVAVINGILSGRLSAERIGERWFPARADVEQLAAERQSARPRRSTPK